MRVYSTRENLPPSSLHTHTLHACACALQESLISQIHEEDNTLNELVQQAKDAEEKRLAELRERFRLTREAAAAAKAAAAK